MKRQTKLDLLLLATMIVASIITGLAVVYL